VLWAGLALLLLTAAAEGAARLPGVRARFPFTSTNNPNGEFDYLLSSLDQAAARYGGVECVILGSSLVGVGFSAAEFSISYSNAGGAPALRCVPLGMPGMVAEQAGTVARLLADLYHPRLLIFGTSARDFNDKITDTTFNAANDFARAAWVRYRLGEGFSVDAWLVEHSYAYRYALNARQWLHNRYYSSRPPQPPGPDLTRLPDPVTEANLYAAMDGYEVSARGLAGLADLLALREQGLEVVVVEMPLHPTYAAFFDQGEADLARWRQTVQTTTEAAGGIFRSAHLALELPSEGWHDRGHLGNLGRQVFSAWLGQEAATGAWGMGWGN
jgi:hypothetical protein